MFKLVPLALLLALAACDAPASDGIARANSLVTVAYEGTLPDGTVFDSSPSATFVLSQTIRGFQTNIAGMAVGESKVFDVAPQDGYGANPPPGIPPNTTLTFDVTLLAVR